MLNIEDLEATAVLAAYLDARLVDGCSWGLQKCDGKKKRAFVDNIHVEHRLFYIALSWMWRPSFTMLIAGTEQLFLLAW